MSNNSGKNRNNSAPKLGSKQNTSSNFFTLKKKFKLKKIENLNQLSEYTIDCPPGLFRLFLSGGTQAAFDLRSDEDITQEDNIRHVTKQTILDDMINKQALSDFSPLRKQIEDYPEDQIVVVYDYEFQHDKNFYICLSPSLKEIILNVIIKLLNF